MGSAIRDYIYIDDAISGILATMMAPPERFQAHDPVFNIGSGRGVSLRELIELLTRVLNKPIKVDYKPGRDFDVRANVLDITRARDILGWSPQVSMEEGLSRQINYLAKNLPDYEDDW